ncbi:MAG: autotransporter outer membrane beta-barrel domain-containing protein, partial [Formosimonas sp.]
VTVDIVSALSANRGIAGIAVYSNNGTATATNKGTVTVTSSAPSATSAASEGIASGGATASIINSGAVNVTNTNSAAVIGLAIVSNNSVNSSAVINNSGTVVVSGYGNNSQAASIAGLGSNTTSAQIINSGTLEVKGGVAPLTGSRSVVAFFSNTAAGAPYVFTNTSTGIVKGDEFAYGVTAGHHSILINNSGSISINNGGYAVVAFNGNDTFNQDAGSTTGEIYLGEGNNTFTLSGGSITGNVVTETGVDAYSMTAGTLTGNTYLGAGNDSFTASGGALIGNTLMGDGDDVATLSGTVDVSAAPQFDGGAGADVLNVDGIALRGFTAASNDGTGNNSNLTGWETINVKNKGSLKLSKHLFADTNTGDLNIDATSTLDLKGNSPGIFSIYGNVNNSGMMTMADGAADDETTITGNYTGVAGSTYAIDTVLGDDNSATDKLIVKGDTSGTSLLNVSKADGSTGALTDKGILVIEVEGASNGTFTMAAPVQAGSYEYTLNQGGKNANAKNWYLNSEIIPTCANTPALCPVDPVKPIYIYRPAVANYVTAQSANADAGFTLLSTLHQRMGEQRGASTGLTTEKAQTWGRIFAGTKEAEGRTRFNYDSTVTGFQFGRDLMHKTDANGTQQRAGVTVQYANNSIDSVDTLRPLAGLNADTGHTNAVSVGLGGYYTHIANDGTYFDVVTQVNHLQNTFHDAYDMRSRQKGWQFGLSGEFGKTVAHIGNWAVEPQAQLSYLYNNYSSFSDKYSNIDGFNAHNLRARLGVRLNKDEMVNGKEAQYYGIVNLHHDLLKPKIVVLNDNNGTGVARVNERFDRTSWEIGAGIQGRVGKATYLYADARYERSFRGNTSAAKVTMGVKSSF